MRPEDPATTNAPPETEAHLTCPPLPDGRKPSAPGYELIALLGAGAFGWVYKAIETATGKVVAVKFFLRGPGARWQSLLEEVRQHARLDSVRGIVELKQVVATADPPYYVMAFADQGSLADRLAHQARLPAEKALDLFRQAAEALAYVHAKGLCHCDLKPGNILLDARGQLLLADFGQAQPTTDGGAALGTLFFMPPEQATPHNNLAAPSWDVYALGAILYVMLTGKPPRFEQGMFNEIIRWPDLPTRLSRYREWLAIAPDPAGHRRFDADLVRIIDRCLALDPRGRFRDAGELVAALNARDQHRRRRPLLAFGVVTTLFTLFVTAFTEARANTEALDTYQRDLTTQLLDSNSTSASLIAQAIEEQMGSRIRRVTGAVTPALAKATQEARRTALETHLRSLLTGSDDRPSRYFAEATVTNRLGELIAMVRLGKLVEDGRRLPELVAIDPKKLNLQYPQFSWRDWFSGRGDHYDQTSVQHPPIERVHVSDPYASSLDPEGLFVSVSAPVRSGEGKVIGVLETAVLIPELSRWIREAHLARDGAVVVYDQRGHRVLHTGKPARPKVGQASRQLIAAEQMAELFPDQVGTIDHFHDPEDGREQLVGYARMTDERVGWVVLVQHDRGQVVAPINALRDRLGWISWQSYFVVVILVGMLWGGLFWTLRRVDGNS